MTDANDHKSPQRDVPPKSFVALLYIPLLVPAALPLYFAMDQEDPVMVTIMVGTTIGVLVFNALVLVAAYRWFSQGAEE